MTRDQTKQHEALILEKLCELLGLDWRVVDSDREVPDGVIARGEVEFGIELAAYVAQTKDNERYEADDLLCAEITAKWLKDVHLQPFTPHIIYKRDGSKRPTVPRRCDIPSFLEELGRAVLRYGPETDKVTKVTLRPDVGSEDDLDFPSLPAKRQLASSAWPVLSEFCSDLLIHPHPGVLLCTAHTSLASGFAGLDKEAIRNTIEKHQCRIRKYRKNLPGVPIWLVVHSDGVPLSRGVFDQHLSQAILAAQRTLVQGGGVFDAALWFDVPTAHGGGTLYPLTDSSIKFCPD